MNINGVDDDCDGWTEVVPGKHSFVNPQLNSIENNHEELDDTIPNIEKRATENDVEISGDIENESAALSEFGCLYFYLIIS